MAILRMIGRWLGWTVLAGALIVALALAMTGCTSRDETNPFIGPNGDSTATPFG